MSDIQNAQPSRELVNVSAIIAALALPVYASAAFFSTWDARFVSLYVGSVIVVIAAGTLLYAKRPRAFGSQSCGDPLRTRYHQPLVHVEPQLASPPAADRAPVWTRDYIQLVLVQSGLVMLALTLNICLAAGVTFALAQAGNPAFFIAAVLILGLFFLIGGRFAVGDMSPAMAEGPVDSPVIELDAGPTRRDPSHPHAA